MGSGSKRLAPAMLDDRGFFLAPGAGAHGSLVSQLRELLALGDHKVHLGVALLQMVEDLYEPLKVFLMQVKHHSLPAHNFLHPSD
mmetsp:Transcript_33417/g.32461  ORF Transcript_33417/g.32461 Transcript_33417/m.32461 type:complete len:85 (+) Transcript_33417:564-818(+)